ncbi:MAG: HEPN domain-containing protein [Nanoarchaeota archaeon]
MEIKVLRKLIANPLLLNKRIKFYESKKIIQKVPLDLEEIKGHISKSEHNLKFVLDNMKLGYYDWCITGCYYAIYQIALALIRAKEVYSKNHDSTLCLLARDYYQEGITKEDIELINVFFLDYQDLLIYVHTKDKREEASYSSKYNFDKDKVEELRLKTIDFINKARGILDNILDQKVK